MIALCVCLRLQYILWIQNIISDYNYGNYLLNIMLMELFYQIWIFGTMAHRVFQCLLLQ
jgi:hypothetical protein